LDREQCRSLPALGIDVRGAGRLEAFFRELFAAVPDYKMTIENLVEGDRHAVVQWTGTGTFTGEPFQGLEPTGKRISLRGCDVIRFASDGTLDENTVYYDGAEFARQTGMLPPRDSAPRQGDDRGLQRRHQVARPYRQSVSASAIRDRLQSSRDAPASPSPAQATA